MRNKRRTFSASFKAKVAIEAIKEQSTMQDLASKYKLHANQISKWKAEFLVNASSVFEKENQDRKSTRLNSSHVRISYAVFCLKKKKKKKKKKEHGKKKKKKNKKKHNNRHRLVIKLKTVKIGNT